MEYVYTYINVYIRNNHFDQHFSMTLTRGKTFWGETHRFDGETFCSEADYHNYCTSSKIFHCEPISYSFCFLPKVSRFPPLELRFPLLCTLYCSLKLHNLLGLFPHLHMPPSFLKFYSTSCHPNILPPLYTSKCGHVTFSTRRHPPSPHLREFILRPRH